MHTNARSGHPAYPERTPVPDENVPWSVPWASYAPIAYTAPGVIENNRVTKPGGWADPEISGLGPEDWKTRVSYEGEFRFDEQNRPLNPRGRTGMADRGLLGKWGCNHAADPVVTRWHPTDKRRLQMVAIKRRDVGQWGIPGGMVDENEQVSAAVRREFTEEAGNISDPEERAQFTAMCDELFAKGEVLYRGHVLNPSPSPNPYPSPSPLSRWSTAATSTSHATQTTPGSRRASSTCTARPRSPSGSSSRRATTRWRRCGSTSASRTPTSTRPTRAGLARWRKHCSKVRE